MRRLFDLDPRSLGLYRIALGLTLVAFAVYKARYAHAFYTDTGIFSPETWNQLSAPMGLTLFALNGSLAWALGVMGALAVAGLLVASGRLVRSALVVSWLVLVSLRHRAPPIGQIADDLIVFWVLWSLFLPLDRALVWGRPAAEPRPVRSAAAVAWQLQLMAVYLLAGIYKLGSAPWVEGTLMVSAVHIAPVATPIARALQSATGLLMVLTWATLPLEVGGWLAAYSPWRTGPVRTATVAAFMGFHLFGIGLLMHLGLVPVVLAIAWLPLLPPWFWDTAWPRLRGRDGGAVQRTPARAPLWQNIVMVALFATSWASYPDYLKAPGTPRTVSREVDWWLRALKLKQQKYSLWTNPGGSRNYVVAATLANGEQWDLHAQQPLDWHQPRRRPYDNQWYKMLQTLPKRPWLQRSVAHWFVTEWNAVHGPDARVVEVAVAVLQAPKRGPQWWKKRPDPRVTPAQSLRMWRMTASYDSAGELKLSAPRTDRSDPRAED